MLKTYDYLKIIVVFNSEVYQAKRKRQMKHDEKHEQEKPKFHAQLLFFVFLQLMARRRVLQKCAQRQTRQSFKYLKKAFMPLNILNQ